MTMATRNSTLFLLVCLGLPSVAPAADVLEPAGAVALPSVKGRIDHFGVDAKRQRLFVAALGNDTLEVVNLKEKRRERSLSGFGEPQGVLYVPGVDRVFVANGSGGRVDVLDGSSLARIRSIPGLDDADNVRYDAETRKVWVGYGKGALRALDPATGDSSGDIRLPGHPESFQLETRGARIFVNVPTARQVAVVDRAKGAVVASWKISGAESNYPMALDESGKRLFVGARRPAVVLVYDVDSGKVVARQPVGGDTDDLFFDSARKRLYVVCGEGRIDVLRQDDPDHYALESTVRTAPRARTGLFVADESKLYVAAPASGGSPAKLLSFFTR
jgi:DNA-binding beta-propeller fold protein YncE